MPEISRDFRSAPVPIRLSCPFSNGITLNYYARALSLNSRVLRVLSVNPFERELQLIVAAPFLSGLVRCQVASIRRSKRQASTYEVDLRYVDSPVLLGLQDPNLDTDPSGKACPSPILSADIANVATELAAELETRMGISFAKAYAQVRDQNRHMKLLALISAVLNLVSEKNLAGRAGISVVVKRAPGRKLHQSLFATPAGTPTERRVG